MSEQYAPPLPDAMKMKENTLSPEILETCGPFDHTGPIEQSLFELVNLSLEKPDLMLTTDAVTVLRHFSLETLNDIEKAVVGIIQDGVIDSKDIPHFIVIIQQMYQVIYSLKHTKLDATKRADVTSTLLKYLIRLLVLERKIKVDEDKQPAFLAQMDTLIDSCITLLSYSKSLKPKCCFAALCK